jgi:UDP-N-acetyl-D-mannosaminuronic acid dehydrogenase
VKNKTVCVVGLGYIGLPTAALLASVSYEVVGVDVSEHAVNTINQGKIHIVEPDLDAVVQATVAAGRLRAYNSPRAADVYMICVPTPFHEGTVIPQPNVDYVMAATRSIAGLLKRGDLVILESTSPVGTTLEMREVLAGQGVDVSGIHIAYCPERVLPGKIMTELVGNDRVVGGVTQADTRVAADFYRTFVKGQVHETDAKTAELCKLAENSFRDVNIAIANELSIICDEQGIDVWRLISLANRHPRVNILQPGAGVGGHCIAVDPWFIVAKNPASARLIRAAREVNNLKTEWVVNKISETMKAQTKRLGRPARLACLGLAFKPDIDDLRESPSLQIARAIKACGGQVIAVEPNIEVHDEFDIVSLEEALAGADVIAVLVKHKQFCDPQAIKRLLSAGSIDFCGALTQG